MKMGVRKVGLMGITILLIGGFMKNVKGDEERLTCEQITMWIIPCITYAVIGGEASPLCCQGVRSLNASFKSVQDIRMACQCVKDRAALIPGVDYDRINALPAKCGTTCPYKVYPTTDCSKVS